MKKILLIEDNDELREITKELLALSNYKVIVAADGREGLEKAIRYIPDLIICDIMMPLLDGYGVLQAIRQHEALVHVPFIFLTAKSEKENYRKGMEDGADDYLVKPVDGTELLKAIDARFKKADSLQKRSDNHKDIELPLKKFPIDENVLKKFITGRNEKVFGKKQLIYSAGERAANMFYVRKGIIKTVKSNIDGKELVTDLYTEGDFLGCVPMLLGGSYKDTAEVLENAEVAVIPRKDFLDLLSEDIEVSQAFNALLARKISFGEEHMLGIAYNSVRKKVAEALIFLNEKYAQPGQGKYSIDISRESLATIAGTATESLIRTLYDFKTEKLIDLNDGRIEILSETKLRNMIN